MRFFLAGLLPLLLLLPAPLGAQQAQEHEVKAAFLVKFPAFVEWPARAGPQQPFTIAVLGAPEVAESLRELARGRSHDGRPLQVREIADAAAAEGAQMLFVGREAAGQLAAIARSFVGKPVLLVAESPGALDQGAALNFVLSDGRVRFDVALDAAEARRLRINARLLAVARAVRGAKS